MTPQPATLTEVKALLITARAAHSRPVMLAALRQIGQLVAEAVDALPMRPAVAWVRHLQQATGLTTDEITLASLAYRARVPQSNSAMRRERTRIQNRKSKTP
jgi:hypothetical protein